MYDPNMVAPMRAELTSNGFEELLTAEAVDQFLDKSKEGTALIVVNSVCGCAAGGARPGVTLAHRPAKQDKKCEPKRRNCGILSHGATFGQSVMRRRTPFPRRTSHSGALEGRRGVYRPQRALAHS